MRLFLSLLALTLTLVTLLLIKGLFDSLLLVDTISLLGIVVMVILRALVDRISTFCLKYRQKHFNSNRLACLLT